VIASPWGQFHLRRRDWEVIAALFRFGSVEELKDFARDQQAKADQREREGS